MPLRPSTPCCARGRFERDGGGQGDFEADRGAQVDEDGGYVNLDNFVTDTHNEWVEVEAFEGKPWVGQGDDV